MQQYRVEARCIVFFAVLLFSFPAVFASEQPSLPNDTRWRNQRIALSLSRSFDSSSNISGDIREALRHSVRAWSEAASVGFEIVDSEAMSVSPKGIKGDGTSLITTAVTADNLKLFPQQSASPAAVTRVFRDVRGYISEADIVLNPFVRFSSDGSFDTFDLQNTLTHEIGHLLGLEHSPVWGSIMYARASRSLGPAYFRGSRDELPQVDSSAVRGLYGPRLDDVKCCGVVSGRISGPLPTARVLVWIEEIDTGRLIAAAVPEKDGTYRVDGLPEGDFQVFAASEGQSDEFASENSKVVVAAAETTFRNFALRPSRSGVRVQLLGTSAQLAGMPVDITAISQDLYIGVDGSPQNIARVGTSGAGILVDSRRSPSTSQVFSSVNVAGFGLTVRPGLPKGEYTLVIEGNTGVRQYLVGSLINH